MPRTSPFTVVLKPLMTVPLESFTAAIFLRLTLPLTVPNPPPR